MQTSRYMNGGAPKTCFACSEPFPHNDTHVRCWKGKDGHYYCSETCEQDVMEARARQRRDAL